MVKERPITGRGGCSQSAVLAFLLLLFFSSWYTKTSSSKTVAEHKLEEQPDVEVFSMPGAVDSFNTTSQCEA